MFLENDFARPLFDFKKGGPPEGFICLMDKSNYFVPIGVPRPRCGKLTKTEQGMRAHLKQIHNWEEQECLYSTEEVNQENRNGQPRKLKLFTAENVEATTKRSLIQDTEQAQEAQIILQPPIVPETSDEISQKLTKEEK